MVTDHRAPPTPPGMRVRTGRFEELRSGEAWQAQLVEPCNGEHPCAVALRFTRRDQLVGGLAPPVPGAHEKTPASLRGFFVLLREVWETGSEIHAAHATHAAARRHRRLVLLRGLGHHGFGGDHQARDGSRILQRGAGDLGRVQDAELDHVAVLAVGGVVAEVALAVGDLVEDDAGLFAGVGDDLAQRRFHGAQGDEDAVVLVLIGTLEAFDRGLGADQRDATARHHAFFHRRTGRVQGVFDARLLFLHFNFGRSAHLDDGHAAGQLGHALLQLLAVVVRRGFFNLRLDLLDAGLDGIAFAGAVDDGFTPIRE